MPLATPPATPSQGIPIVLIQNNNHWAQLQRQHNQDRHHHHQPVTVNALPVPVPVDATTHNRLIPKVKS
jgi:hypothetical protein